MQLHFRSLLAFLPIAGAMSALPVTEPPKPPGFQPFPSVVQFAKSHSIALDGFELAGAAAEARPGDTITVLFTIQQGTVAQQWLAEFRSVTLTDHEASSKPGSGLGLLSVFQTSLKTDTGHEYAFPQAPAALQLRTFGPFPGSAEVKEVNARVLATRDYLVHGLAPMGEIELRLRQKGKKNPGLSYMFIARFSDEQMTAAKTRAQAAGFTEDDERAYAEGIFALVQFANLAFRTDGVDTITREIADSPTLFSGAFINLDWNKLQIEDGSAWGLPATRIFRLPYFFKSKTQAGGTFYVTAPQPPLQNMAGIVGLTVDWTSKTAAKRLIVRVLAGRRGTP
jgi:hypothetical protein